MSFSSATFKVLQISGPQREDGADVSVRHIPGGDNVYIDIGGKVAPTMVLDLYFDTNSKYTALRNLVGTQATLTTSEGSVTAVLTKLARTRRMPNGQHFASATFVLVV